MDNKQELYPHTCHICGNEKFIWGKLLGQARTHFRPEGGIWGDGKPLNGRQCTRCGNVQVFVKMPNARKRKE